MDEMEMYNIVARQKAITDELQRLKVNISKDGPDRKTVDYKAKKIRSLEALWLEFSNNHDQIHEYIKQDTPYVQNHTYEKVKLAYNEMRQVLKSIVPIGGETTTSKQLSEAKGTTSFKSPHDETAEKQTVMARLDDVTRIIRRQAINKHSLQCLTVSKTLRKTLGVLLSAVKN